MKKKHPCCHVGTTESLSALESTSAAVAGRPAFVNDPFNLQGIIKHEIASNESNSFFKEFPTELLSVCQITTLKDLTVS